MGPVQIDRRGFLRGAAVLGGALPFAGFAQGAQPDLIARKIFFDNPDVGSVQISPDGRTLSWLAPVNGARRLFLPPPEDPPPPRALTFAADRNLSSYYRWAHTNRHPVFLQ